MVREERLERHKPRASYGGSFGAVRLPTIRPTSNAIRAQTWLRS